MACHCSQVRQMAGDKEVAHSQIRELRSESGDHSPGLILPLNRCATQNKMHFLSEPQFLDQ